MNIELVDPAVLSQAAALIAKGKEMLALPHDLLLSKPLMATT